MLVIVQCPSRRLLRMIAMTRIMDAVDCIKKYLVAASVERGFIFLVIIGIKANMFISKPAQARNQCELNSVVSVPVIIVV